MIKKLFFLSYICLYGLLVRSEAARILGVFLVPSISHHLVFRPLTQELAKRGHEVIVITTDPAYSKGQTPANLTEIDIHDLSYRMAEELLKLTQFGKLNEEISVKQKCIEYVNEIFKQQLLHYDVQRLIKDKDQQFDLILLASYMRHNLVFSHIFNAPAIRVSSRGVDFDSEDVMGFPSHPILYPAGERRRISNLTIQQKITESYDQFLTKKAYHDAEKLCDDILREIIDPNFESLEELNKNVHMLFLNEFSIWESNRPVPPGIVYMGGIHMKPQKELPKDLKSYLDSSDNGIIYMSFGTNVNTGVLPPHKVEMFVKVFSELPYNILWKWNQNELPGQTANIRISQWVPQSDILRHPKVKLFITHGGLQSTFEAINAGVPMIGIPMFLDQWSNCEKLAIHKIGVNLNFETITEERLKDTINLIVKDESYRRNVVKFRTWMHDQPQPPLQRAVWWTEHVLRHGGAHLRAPAANMSWWEFLELELIFTVLICFLVFLALLILFTISVFNYVLRILKKLNFI